MGLLRYSRPLHRVLSPESRLFSVQSLRPAIISLCNPCPSRSSKRKFHSSRDALGIRSQVLKDVGEGEKKTQKGSLGMIRGNCIDFCTLLVGITEIQIIQWYAQEGARIEEWNPLCQYQSDKAVDDVRPFFFPVQ